MKPIVALLFLSAFRTHAAIISASGAAEITESAGPTSTSYAISPINPASTAFLSSNKFSSGTSGTIITDRAIWQFDLDSIRAAGPITSATLTFKWIAYDSAFTPSTSTLWADAFPDNGLFEGTDFTVTGPNWSAL